MSTVTAWQVIGGKMSYIDALFKKDEDKIYVVERDPRRAGYSQSTMPGTCSTTRTQGANTGQ